MGLGHVPIAGLYDYCEHCDRRLWRDFPCGHVRCSSNSRKHLRRHGERLAENIRRCGGQVLMLTLTAPGARGGCPWDPTRCTIRGPHEHSGPDGCRVESLHAELWNDQCLEFVARLNGICRERAHRQVKGVRSRYLAKTVEMQARGVLHPHLLLCARTPLERRWCEAYVAAARGVAASVGFSEQLRVGEWGPPEQSVYVAKYCSKPGGVQPLWESGRLPARAFYVCSEMTVATGVTIRSLRRRGQLWFEGVRVSTSALASLREFERALGRSLGRSELVCLDGVSLRL